MGDALKRTGVSSRALRPRVAVLSALVVAAAVTSTRIGPAGSPHAVGFAAPAKHAVVSRLFYQQGPFIVSVNALGGSRPRRVRPLDSPGALAGIAVAGSRIFWATDGRRGGDAIFVASGAQGPAVLLVRDLAFPHALIAAGGFLYWADDKGFGRVALDGSRLQRRFIRLPRQRGGGVADGIASDGSYLYFTRCQDGTISRATLDGTRVQIRFIALGDHACPQAITVSAHWLYWSELGVNGTIRRADADGTRVDDTWFRQVPDQGPFEVAAAAQAVFWIWGGPRESFVGRVRSDGSGATARFVRGDNALMAARCTSALCWSDPSHKMR